MIKRLAKSPLTRISLGLVLLTISILLVGDIFFRLGDQSARAILDARKQLCESLAVQFSVLISQRDTRAIESTLNTVVRRNEAILSAALRANSGEILVEAGVHDRYWKKQPFDKSTPTHAQVPLFNGTEPWGTVEVRFTPLDKSGVLNALSDPFFGLMLFVAVMGFGGYLLFMKRTLRHLDPAAVIPDRVKTALDVLAEGVVLVNEKSEIVLANSAFLRKLGEADKSLSLLGRNLSDMKWRTLDGKRKATELPWRHALETAESALGVALSLATPADGIRTFVVNGSPILDDAGAARGAMVTFDDITELEKKNDELKSMLESLQISQKEVNQQNEKLQILATRDSLTSCLNRRSFNEKCEQELDTAERDGKPLSCIMMDIDHFKSINDTFGHAIGDRVIRQVVDAIRSGLRSIDSIGRYGGEEFCILLPGLDLDQASIVAERLRFRVEAEAYDLLVEEDGRIVTCSFGVASTEVCPFDTSKLVDGADRAMYVSKNGGRNRVSRLDDIANEQVA